MTPRATEETVRAYLADIEEVAIGLLLLSRTPLEFDEKGFLTPASYKEHAADLSQLTTQLGVDVVVFQHGPVAGKALLDKLASALDTVPQPEEKPKLTLVPE